MENKYLDAVIGYTIRVGDAISQLLNVLIFFSLNPNESISGRSWRLRQEPFWGIMRLTIDFIASPFEADHCKNAHDADVLRAQQMITGRG